MTPHSALEIEGNFLMHPFAELIAEIAQARVTGSLRASNGDRKCVVYFRSGIVVFAVSNARSSRLFDIMLRRGKLSKNDLAEIPNFANDFEFSAFLKEKNFLSKTDVDRLFSDQIEGILVDLLTWESGDWSFSSLARIRDGLSYQINTTRLLVDYARTLAVDKMLKRFRSLDERFVRSELSEANYDLSPGEAFVLSRSIDGELSAQDLVHVAAVTESVALQLIYTLWLGGLLIRKDWQAAFSKASISAMRSAKLELKVEAKIGETPAKPAEVKAPEPIPVEDAKPVAEVISLEEYLTRVEQASTHYDILGVDVKADIDELKRAYFFLAKMFHPDRFHSEGGEKLKRVQNAFTQLAQAHETLKAPDSREVYDYRMRKELAEREKREASGDTGNIQSGQAAENFDRGFDLLMDQNSEGATPFLARAAHFAPKNARYRAYYGKALSSDDKQRHKAEAEMQAAVKIDPDNPTYRLILAEFFIQVNLMKRAEGELNRLLAIYPSNREARALLDSIRAKT